MAVTLERTIAACERFREPALSALLVAQLALVFVVAPLADMGFGLVLAPVVLVMVILILVVASHRPGALALAIAALCIRAVTMLLELHKATFTTEVVNAIASMLLLLALVWVISSLVFSGSRITSHRVLGAVVLYLATAMVFAWLYRMIAELAPGAFAGLHFRAGGVFAIAPFNYFSLVTLTTLGFGDITPVDPLARSLTTLEAVIGQLYPAIILARILTLYSEGKARAGS